MDRSSSTSCSPCSMWTPIGLLLGVLELSRLTKDGNIEMKILEKKETKCDKNMFNIKIIIHKI